jgi:NADH-quinone oxidoreductase subunit G/NADP-reducing hydrogenase subunit HndD
MTETITTIALTINGHSVTAPAGATILEAAQETGIKIPTLCYLKDVNEVGACRVCVVEVTGQKHLMASCVTPVTEGMEVLTASPRVRHARRVLYELLMSDHPHECLHCARNGTCELQELGRTLGIPSSRLEGRRSKSSVDDSSVAVVLDSSKCILCRRCVAMCNEVQGVGTLNVQHRGFGSRVGPGDGILFADATCSLCGQCTTVCPVDALHEADATGAVWGALADPEKVVVVQTAPAVRAALGEEFGLEAGTLVTGRMVSSLRELGFAHVFDTNFAADLTILEEGYELLRRLVADAVARGAVPSAEAQALGLGRLPEEAPLPMITSCSPGWVKYVEHFYPDHLGHLSTCKSPHMMLGALTKSWFAAWAGIDPAKLFVVSVMPCTAKKFEVTRPELANDGLANVDAVLTTRELGRMVRQAGIDFASLPEGTFDNPMGVSTGAADIFGVTGGVMEAALRTVVEVLTGVPVPPDYLAFAPIRGLARVKSAQLTLTGLRPKWAFLEGAELSVAVTNGLHGAAELMDEIVAGTSPYQFIEIMGCPGGCISGGGQPRMTTPAVRQARLEAIYREDSGKPLRTSHTNPDIQRLYAEFLGAPGAEVPHHLLHTQYTRRRRR